MSCNCSCSYNNLACCCQKQDGETYPCPTTICPDAQKCDVVIESDCIKYNGKSYTCVGVTKGMTVKQVIDIIIKSLSLECTTTTTTSTSTTSTTSTSTTTTRRPRPTTTTTTRRPTTTTSTTTSTTSTTTSTTTTTIGPGNNPCTSLNVPVNCKCEFSTYNTANTNSQSFPQNPSCGNYLGNDIWLKFIVPASGEVVISTSALQITDGALSIYKGSSCNNITELVCVDDINGSSMPQVYLNSLTPGSTLYIRFWGYGGGVNNQVGTFKICVFDAVFDPTCDIPPGGDASACPTTTTTTTENPCDNGGGTGKDCTFGIITGVIVTPTTTTSTSTTSTSTTSTSTTTTAAPCSTPICGVTYEGYGYLYNWYAIFGTGAQNNGGRENGGIINTSQPGYSIFDTQNLWFVPSATEWATLVCYLDPSCSTSNPNAISITAGKKLKTKCSNPFTTNNGLWFSPNSGTNELNWTGVPGGYRNIFGAFSYINRYGQWWSSSLPLSYRGLYATTDEVLYGLAGTTDGYSIRLVRQATSQEQQLLDGTTSNQSPLIPPYVGNNGKLYITVKIGTQIWTAQNLMETKYNDTNLIPEVSNTTAWATATTGARCTYNNGTITPDQGQVELCANLTTTTTTSTTTTTTQAPLDCVICETYGFINYTSPFTIQYTPCGSTSETTLVLVDPGPPFTFEPSICIQKNTPLSVISGRATVNPNILTCCTPPPPTSFNNCNTGLLVINKSITSLNVVYDDGGAGGGGLISMLPCDGGSNTAALSLDQSKGWYPSFEVSNVTITGSLGANYYYEIYVDGILYSSSTFFTSIVVNGISAWSYKLVKIVIYKMIP